MCIIRPLPASQTDTTPKRNCSFCNILISKYRTAQFTMDTTISICLKDEIGWRLVGLDLCNDDTCPSGHISRPTQVNVSQSCFNSLNILLKLNYIVQVWGLAEVNCVISDRRIPLLAGIPLCKSRELSRRGYPMSQLCSIHHDIPVTLHTPGAYGQWSAFDHNGDK